LLKLPWTAKRTNASMSNHIKPKHSVKALATTIKLKYFGHTLHTSDSQEKSFVLGLTCSRNKKTKHKR
jgi:hypothetical protein